MSHHDLGGSEQNTDPATREPEIDPDDRRRLAEEHPDAPHEPTRFDAGNGQVTSSGPPYGQQYQERRVMDGSTQSSTTEAFVPNPYRGVPDAGRVTRQPPLNSTRASRWLISGAISLVLIAVVLGLLFRVSPFWCGLGIAFALLCLAFMLGARATRMTLPALLRTEAVLLVAMWAGALAVILPVLFAWAYATR